VADVHESVLISLASSTLKIVKSGTSVGTPRSVHLFRTNVCTIVALWYRSLPRCNFRRGTRDRDNSAPSALSAAALPWHSPHAVGLLRDEGCARSNRP